MDAGYQPASRVSVLFVGIWLCMLWVTGVSQCEAADYRTQNFIIFAPDPALAKSVGDAAEAYRHDLADHWLGRTLPNWPQPCPIRVIAGNIPAQGVTTYNPNPVSNFQMEVVGTPERILDSVLPHEVTHTILATHFGRPLPRWADEGICTTVEHISERQKYEEKLREFLRTRRGIAMNKLFLLTEYPSDVLPMYAQGYSVCQFLIAQRGPQNFVTFLGDYMARPSWTENVRRHYGYESLAELQDQWLKWVSVGNGPVDQFAKNVAPRSQATNGPAPVVSLAAATRDSFPQAGLNRNAAFDQRSAGLVSSSDISDSWYSRQRREAVDQGPANASNTVPGNAGRRSDPPSIYSASQPQPEQGATSPATNGSFFPGNSTYPGNSAYPAGSAYPATIPESYPQNAIQRQGSVWR